MDTSGYDVTQIWIGEEATNQTWEFLQSTHGSNGFTSEVPFGLVDAGATDAVGFDILPYPLVGVEFRRISRELEQAQLSMGRSHEVFDCFGTVDRMTVDKYIKFKKLLIRIQNNQSMTGLYVMLHKRLIN